MEAWMEHSEESRKLAQWLKVADNWIGEEFLMEEFRHLRAASQLIEDRISNLESMINAIQWNRDRLHELDRISRTTARFDPPTTGDE